jgi:hypothetical protein
LKPFNLERALAGDKVVTRTGKEVKDVKHFSFARTPCPVLAVVDGHIFRFSPSGMFEEGLGLKNPIDLFMAPKTRTVWVNLYNGTVKTPHLSLGYFYKSEEDANKGLEEDNLQFCYEDLGPGKNGGIRRLGGKAHPLTFEE